MQIDEKRPPRDEKLLQLRRELFERIVRNEARRRTEQDATLGGPGIALESPTGFGGHNG